MQYGCNEPREVTNIIATNDHEKIYYQVTDDMTAELTRQRELAPLKMVRDNYRKVMQDNIFDDPFDIIHVSPSLSTNPGSDPGFAVDHVAPITLGEVLLCRLFYHAFAHEDSWR